VKNINKIFTFISFIVPLVLYIVTMAPTTSFWDCGEFIATSYILGVPHPPGSPLFLLLGNVFSHIPLFGDIGARVNIISPLASAFSVMFLYLIIVQLLETLNNDRDQFSNLIINNVSALIAALTFAITDSHWFNAVEAEVYSLSTFFTAIVLWMILKWSSLSDNRWNIRYLLLIAYMFGLAIGIHILNLLALPFVTLIVFFKKYKYSLKKLCYVIGITLLIFVTIYYGIILGLPDFVSKINSLSIIIILFLLLFSSVFAIHFRHQNIKLNTTSKIISVITLVIISLLIYNKLFIKSASAISNNYDEEIRIIDDSFYYYLNQDNKSADSWTQEDYDFIEKLKKERNVIIKNQQIFDKKKESLGFLGLLLWQSNIVILGFLFLLIGIPIYYYSNNKNSQFSLQIKIFFMCFILILIGYSSYTTIFIRAGQDPRINENNPNTLDRALSYINRDQYGAITSFNPSSAIQSSSGGHWKRWTNNKENPTLKEQLRFVWNYQIKEMYLRYFAWQFIGRSDKHDKPWLIKDLNDQLVGNRELDGVDFFRYGFPLAFLFGLLGIYYHFNSDWKRALAVLSVFLATGLMLVLYLNQYDPQPRERDYSYVGSFFAFSIWIGIGISYLQQKIRDFFNESNISSFISITISCFIFMLMTMTMGAADFKEHSRKGNYVAWDYGYNLLNSCEPNGIIFTNGDNDTFPLWYLQEVENIRKDVKVVNLSLLNTPWYIEQLMNQEPKLEIKFTNDILLKDIYKIESDYLISTTEGYKLCSKNFTGEIPWDHIDCELVVNNQSTLKFKVPSYKKQVLRIQDYIILQIIKDVFNKQPIYFAATVSENNQVGLGEYLQMEGMTYRLLSSPSEIINYDKMRLNLTQGTLTDTIKTASDYDNAINNNKGIYRFTNLNNKDIYFSDNIKRLVQNYRIGYLRLMQNQIIENNLKEAELLAEQMNEYFPNDVLPIDPWLGFEIIDKIYKPLKLKDKQKKMLEDLIMLNSDTNIKLISVLRALELGHDDLAKSFINDYIAIESIPIESKIALLFETTNSTGSNQALTPLIDDIINNYDLNMISLNDKYALLGILTENNFISESIAIGQSLLINHYDNDLNDINTQKYVADILFEIMVIDDFINFCEVTFENHKIEGLLYALVNAYQTNGQFEKAINELNRWLIDNPNNQRMINKKQKVIKNQSIQ